MELFIFARFHARPGNESAVEKALRDVIGPSSEEPGCSSILPFARPVIPTCSTSTRAERTRRRSRVHAGLPHTVRFLERIAPLLDHPLDITRAERIG